MTIVVALSSCGSHSTWRPDDVTGDDLPDMATLEVSAEGSDAAVDWRGGSIGFAVTSSAEWTATCDADWCALQPSRGKSGTSKITVNVAANSADERETSLQVVAGNRKASVKIVQAAKPELMLSATALSFGSASASQMLIVKCNVDWSAKVDADWCSLAPASGKTGTTAVTVSARQNSSGAERQAAITIVAGGESTKVSVTQSAAE
ncbi:MAG: BACON domain-containing protein [Muribaculaceae bacterium]